jgi:hypothetical protein
MESDQQPGKQTIRIVTVHALLHSQLRWFRAQNVIIVTGYEQ